MVVKAVHILLIMTKVLKFLQ